MCSRTIVIAHGRILADETPAELATRTRSGRLDDAFRALTLDTVPDVEDAA